MLLTVPSSITTIVDSGDGSHIAVDLGPDNSGDSIGALDPQTTTTTTSKSFLDREGRRDGVFSMTLHSLHKEKLRMFKMKQFLELQKKTEKLEEEAKEKRTKEEGEEIKASHVTERLSNGLSGLLVFSSGKKKGIQKADSRTQIRSARRLAKSLSVPKLTQVAHFNTLITYSDPEQRLLFNIIEVIAGECSEIIVRVQYIMAR